MSKINELLSEFSNIAASPKAQADKYISQGKKLIGVFPYYVPEEIIHASGMVPFGVWGANEKAVSAAKKYFATFYCSLAQMNLEMGLNGTLDVLSGVVVTSMCDTLRPLSQNFRVGVPNIPFLFLAHPQNRKEDYGVKYTKSIYTTLKGQLEEIAGHEITDASLKDAIKVYNESRAARRKFVELAGKNPSTVSPKQRSAVLKSAHFMLKEEHTALLNQLNEALEKLPEDGFKGSKVVTSGIIVDNPRLLDIFAEMNMAIAADDVAHESRGFRLDVPEDSDPMTAIALHFAGQDQDPLLYDPAIDTRPAHIIKMVKDSGAEGVVVLMMQFCDPEEMEYPSLKQGLEKAGVPYVMVGVDPQMTDYEQARTSLQAFADVLSMRK